MKLECLGKLPIDDIHIYTFLTMDVASQFHVSDARSWLK